MIGVRTIVVASTRNHNGSSPHPGTGVIARLKSRLMGRIRARS